MVNLLECWLRWGGLGYPSIEGELLGTFNARR
jgi:hypothetical protein